MTRQNGGSAETYTDIITDLGLGYGLSETVSLYLAFPLRYRSENSVYNTSSFGLGDAKIGGRFRAVGRDHSNFHLTFDLAVKFPTASAGTVGLQGSTQSVRPKIPLGTGNTDVIPLVVLDQRVTSWLELDETLGFSWRSEALVEYLTTTPVLVGNLRIDWGDEWFGRMGIRFKLGNHLRFRCGGAYLWRTSTTVESFDITTDTNDAVTSSTPTTVRLGRGHYASAYVETDYVFNERWRLKAGWNHPLWGKNYPLPSLSFVESLLGETYSLGVDYGF